MKLLTNTSTTQCLPRSEETFAKLAQPNHCSLTFDSGESDSRENEFAMMVEPDREPICICSKHPLPHYTHGPDEPIRPVE